MNNNIEKKEASEGTDGKTERCEPGLLPGSPGDPE